jgi:hypothetical protein
LPSKPYWTKLFVLATIEISREEIYKMKKRIRRFTRKTLTATEIDIYAEYLKGNRKHEQSRKAPGDYKETTGARIVPFGLSPSGANFTRVSVTRGALGIIALIGTTNVDGIYGLELTDGPAKDVAGFYPALAKITLKEAGVSPITSGVSAFTGRPRNYKPGRSGSLPFGRGSTTAQPDAGDPTIVQTTIADIDYLDAVNGIKGSISSSAFPGKKQVSFEPEVFRADREAASFGKAAVAPVF